jgi:HSP20 family protein
MATRRENPLERLQRDFDVLFNRLTGGWLVPVDEDMGSMRLWDFDVTEKDNEIVVRAELPGFEENEIDVRLDNGVLTIKAEKEQRGEEKEEYRSFLRSITLPTGIDTEKAQATYHNGVLELHIPRAANALPKRIQVQGQQAALNQQGQEGMGRQSAANEAQAASQGQQAGNQAQQSSNQEGAAASAKAKK